MYPRGKTGGAISGDRALADVADAASTAMVYRSATPPFLGDGPSPCGLGGPPALPHTSLASPGTFCLGRELLNGEAVGGVEAGAGAAVGERVKAGAGAGGEEGAEGMSVVSPPSCHCGACGPSPRPSGPAVMGCSACPGATWLPPPLATSSLMGRADVTPASLFSLQSSLWSAVWAPDEPTKEKEPDPRAATWASSTACASAPGVPSVLLPPSPKRLAAGDPPKEKEEPE